VRSGLAARIASGPRPQLADQDSWWVTTATDAGGTGPRALGSLAHLRAVSEYEGELKQAIGPRPIWSATRRLPDNEQTVGLDGSPFSEILNWDTALVPATPKVTFIH
jgi:hypothetical protein